MPGAAERVCRVLGSSRVVGDALLRQPDVVELLGDDDWLVAERSPRGAPRGGARDPALARRPRRASRRACDASSAASCSGSAHATCSGWRSVEVTGRELADLADASIEAALESLASRTTAVRRHRHGSSRRSRAVVRVGRRRAVRVRRRASPSDFERARAHRDRAARARSARRPPRARRSRSTRACDPRGSRVRSPARSTGYRQYYERWVQPWELQALLRARPVAGDADVGAAFMELIEPFVYRDPFPEEDAREIRRIKARVERERIPTGEDPEFHLKLGRGGLTDVEFTVQLLQLEHGAAHPEVREPSTTVALGAPRRPPGSSTPTTATMLGDAYVFCERARNARFLVTGKAGDALPGGADGRRVARLLGYVHRPEAELRDDYRRLTRRARRVVERLFYGT